MQGSTWYDVLPGTATETGLGPAGGTPEAIGRVATDKPPHDDMSAHRSVREGSSRMMAVLPADGYEDVSKHSVRPK